MLRISSLALFFHLFLALPTIPALAAERREGLDQGTRRHLVDFRHIQASLYNPFMRRGGPIAINRQDRCTR
jgi:hypothetical protein